MLSIVMGILPGVFFSVLFYLLDKNRKKLKFPFLLGAFLCGCLSSYLCYRLEWHFGSYFKKVAESNLLEVFFYALFGVAIFEEGAKLFFSLLFILLNKVKEKTNILTYCVITSCGFLAFETTVFYPGLGAAISRMLSSSPSHVCFAVFMGMILLKNQKIDWKMIRNLFFALFVPSILHALYNTFLYPKNESLYVYTYVVLFVLVGVCVRIVLDIYFKKNN